MALDALLLVEEGFSYDFNRYQRFGEYTGVRLIRALEFKNADRQRVEKECGLSDYLAELRPPGTPASLSPTDSTRFFPVYPHRPSLALCDLATVARAAGKSVKIIDNVLRFPFRWEQAEQLMRAEKPRLVGISTTFIMDPEVVRMLVEKLRAVTNAKIVVGGPTIRRIVELHDAADFSVFGSGEQPFLDVLDAVDGKRSPASIPYIAYRNDDGTVGYGPVGRESSLQIGRAYKARINETIPISDWTTYSRSRDSVFPLEFSRGCKYNCYYCSYDRGKNIRSLSDVKMELLANHALGITKYRISDSNFTDGPPTYPRYPHDVCQTMIDLDLKLEWSCYARVDDMSDELADLMKRSGCFAVFFGIESGDDRVLKLMRKGHDSADARRGIAIAKKAGLLVHANFVVGYPGETRETFQTTLDFIKETRPDSACLSQFYLEQNSPVMGEKMVTDHAIVGGGTQWAHATMSSDVADALVRDGLVELSEAGQSIGAEYSYPIMMSLGLSFAEAREFLVRSAALVGQDAPPDVRENARGWLREMFLTRFPAAIAADIRMMQNA